MSYKILINSYIRTHAGAGMSSVVVEFPNRIEAEIAIKACEKANDQQIISAIALYDED